MALAYDNVAENRIRVPPAPAKEPDRELLQATDFWKSWSQPRGRVWPLGVVLAWCGFLFFFGITAGELWRTESLRAIIGQEMLHSGNWIVPRLYGEPLFTKPPLMYVAIALCGWPFGEVTDWSARIPSAVAATLTVFLFYWYFKRQLGQTAGLVAALIVPMAPMWLDKASAAEMDMMQVAWVAAALLFFFRALEAHDSHARPRTLWFWWLAALLCMAGGMLTKWTAPAFFYATALTLLWWRGQLRLLWTRFHLGSAALAAAVCLSWVAAAVALEGWEVFYLTVKREALARLVPNYAGHPYPWWQALYHPLIIALNTLPWCVVAVWALRPSFARLWDERGRRLLQEMHCWVWPNVLFLSLLAEHTPRHSFPMFPGVAGLAALVVVACLTGRLSWKLPRISPVRFLAGCLVLWMICKVVFVFAIVPVRNMDRQPQAKGALLAGLVPAGKVLYLFRLKDEGIMFYYGRPVLRLASPAQLPASAGPIYCILTKQEWAQWSLEPPTETVQDFTDEQGAPVVLVRVVE